MIIGINTTAAIKQPRTGVEEYIYQLIKHLTMLPGAGQHRFLLFVPSFEKGGLGRILDQRKIPPSPPFLKGGGNSYFDFPLPQNFEIKILKWPLPFLWTQIRLAWEIFRRRPDILFIPVHILPIFHPKNSFVTIHGLEYEYFPKYYPLLHRLYLRFSTKYALKHAKKIIAISESTKKDLVKLYDGDAGKIEVVHHGVNVIPAKAGIQESGFRLKAGMTISKPYLLYLGRIEQKKNLEGILKAYRILKEKYQIPHALVLAGAPGYAYKNIKYQISPASPSEAGRANIKTKEDVILTGFVGEDEKLQLLGNCGIFLFPSFYEGFGLPVLEAQTAGVPVITSFNSSLPEIAGEGALFVNPRNPEQIAQAVKSLIDDKNLRDKLIQSGFKNLKRFSWEKCAGETLKIITRNYESSAGA